MCGRYVSPEEAEIECFYELPKRRYKKRVSWNVAPGQSVLVVRSIEGENEAEYMSWGLVPFWAKERKIGYKMINARAETVASKPAYRAAFKYRRCLIPAAGFYEWQKHETGKTPHYIYPANDDLFSFAGLWESWKESDDAEPLETCTIITTEPNAFMARLHNRMPVILDSEQGDTWLRGDDSKQRSDLLRSCPDSLLASHAVSDYVNSPKNNDSRCIQPIA